MPVFKVITQARDTGNTTGLAGKYHDMAAIETVITYVLNPAKTDARYVGGCAINPRMAAQQFSQIAEAYGKNTGIHLRHMVLSFQESEPLTAEQAFYIAHQIAQYYGDAYQILFALHLDHANYHVHFVMNTVSYRTGAKYAGDKRDYYRFIQYMERVLAQYGMGLSVCSDRTPTE